ncbi:Ger(x)C family spore germination protein [Gracilibacillus sp. YIM 98692]|uniref:Ger(x)C family spore germination protein n=1 Tax=Gracilibacillus sp. YIM 98692 TaxID=2663532 RepID=UPI0013D0B3BA|nr:Ger(x)C family spore germination protein [Gracilibacillus sp. YIM 98692]
MILRKTFIIILTTIFLTGCWDRLELTEIGMVVAMAIDIDSETGEYILTSQYLRPATESTLSPSGDNPTVLVSVNGKTISDLMRKANQEIDRKGFYAHNKMVIVSEDVAKAGLIPVLETFQRRQEVRGYVWLAVAKNVKAKDILSVEGNSISRIPAQFLYSLFSNAEYNAVTSNLLQYYKQVLKKGENPVTGVVKMEEEKEVPHDVVNLVGGAAFQKDKLVGFLNEREARGYNWLKAKGPHFERGALYLTSLLEEEKLVTVLIKDVKSNITPIVKGPSEISFRIDVKQVAEITGQQSTKKMEKKLTLADYLKKVEKLAENEVKDQVQAVIAKAQKEYKSDIFGLGNTLKRKEPETWSKVENNWPQTFQEVECTVNVEVDLLNSGLIQGTLDPSE